MAFVIYVIGARARMHLYTDLRGLHDRDPLELSTLRLSLSLSSPPLIPP